MALLAEIKWPPELDDTCKKILAVFIKGGKSYRSNQLLKEIKLSGIKGSKPKILDHLNHLEEKKLILREEKDSLHVTYAFNHKLWGDIYERVRRTAKSKRMIEEKMQKFNTFPIEDQLTYVHTMYVVTDLLILRDLIDAFLDEDKELLFQVNQYNHEAIKMAVASRLIKNCQEKDEKYVLELKGILDELINSYFDQPLSPTNLEIE